MEVQRWRLQGHDEVRACVAQGEIAPTRAAVKPTRTPIRSRPPPKSMRSIIDATQREQRHGSA